MGRLSVRRRGGPSIAEPIRSLLVEHDRMSDGAVDLRRPALTLLAEVAGILVVAGNDRRHRNRLTEALPLWIS